MGSGVMLFFVISGFCIHLPYAGAKGKPLAWKEYAARRFFRIYPPYLVALAFAVVVEIVGVRMGIYPAVNPNVDFAAVFMLQGFLGAQPATNDAMWTLPVEVTYYLLYPLIYFGFRAVSANGTLLLCLAANLAALGYDFTQATTPAFSFLPYWAVWTSGAVLAEFHARGTLRKPSILAGLFAIVMLGCAGVATCLRHNPSQAPIGHVVQFLGTFEAFNYGCFFVIFLWWSLTHLPVYDGLPGWLARCLDLLGNISYSLYLFHIPLFLFCGWTWVALFQHKPVHYVVSCSFAIPAVLLAWIMYRLVEAPSHEMGRKGRGITGQPRPRGKTPLSARSRPLRSPR